MRPIGHQLNVTSCDGDEQTCDKREHSYRGEMIPQDGNDVKLQPPVDIAQLMATQSRVVFVNDGQPSGSSGFVTSPYHASPSPKTSSTKEARRSYKRSHSEHLTFYPYKNKLVEATEATQTRDQKCKNAKKREDKKSVRRKANKQPDKTRTPDRVMRAGPLGVSGS